MPIAVLPEVFFECLGQGEAADATEGAHVAHGGSGQELEGEAVAPIHGMQKHRLKEHATQRLLEDNLVTLVLACVWRQCFVLAW